MERKHGDAFGFETITEGCFRDQGFNIRTIVIRLSCTALDEWITSKKQQGGRKKVWERKILDMLKFPATEGYSITRSVSELFTVVLFEEE